MNVPGVNRSPSGRALDRGALLVMVLSVLTAIVVIGLTVLATVRAGSAADNSDRVAEGNEIAACRAALFSTAQDAAAQLDRARADLDILVASGLEAVLRNDDEAVDRTLALIHPAIERVAQSADAADLASAAYDEAAQLAFTDPDQFLINCRSVPTGG